MVASAIDPLLQILEDLFSVKELTMESLLQAHGDGGTEGISGGFLFLEKAQSFPDDFSFRGVLARRNPGSNEIFEIGGECDLSRSVARHTHKIHPALPTPQRAPLPGDAGLPPLPAARAARPDQHTIAQLVEPDPPCARPQDLGQSVGGLHQVPRQRDQLGELGRRRGQKLGELVELRDRGAQRAQRGLGGREGFEEAIDQGLRRLARCKSQRREGGGCPGG